MKVRIVGDRPLSVTFRNLIGVWCVCVFLLGIGYRGFTNYITLHKLQVERQQKTETVRQLTIENIHRSAEVNSLKNDPQTLEEIARRDLKLARPDDTIYLLPAPTTQH